MEWIGAERGLKKAGTVLSGDPGLNSTRSADKKLSESACHRPVSDPTSTAHRSLHTAALTSSNDWSKLLGSYG